MSDNKLKVGLIGCGRFALPGHALPYYLNPACDFTSVCDVREEQARGISKKFGAQQVYTDYEDMLDNSGVDAVSICTPTFTHPDIASAAAGRGIHVLCEKPLATSAAESRKIVDICSDSGVVLHTGFHKRYDSGIARVRQMIREEKYGRCFGAEFRWDGLSTFGTVPAVNTMVGIMRKFGYSSEKFSPDWRLKDPRTPGGVLEVLCHLLDLAVWFFGTPDEVTGDAATVSEDAVKPEHAAVLFKYNDGPAVYITMSIRALAMADRESGLFNCTGGNIRYSTGSTRQTFLPAKIIVETDDGPFGMRRPLVPRLKSNPLMNMPLYHRNNNFILDARGQLPPEEEDSVATGEAGLAIDMILEKIKKR